LGVFKFWLRGLHIFSKIARNFGEMCGPPQLRSPSPFSAPFLALKGPGHVRVSPLKVGCVDLLGRRVCLGPPPLLAVPLLSTTIKTVARNGRIGPKIATFAVIVSPPSKISGAGVWPRSGRKICDFAQIRAIPYASKVPEGPFSPPPGKRTRLGLMHLCGSDSLRQNLTTVSRRRRCPKT
jgi:hypothetical protein